MRVVIEGRIVSVYQRKSFTRNYGNGGSAEVPDTWLLLLAQAFDSTPARVRLSDAQASELNNPALQFEGIKITGESIKDPGGFGQLIDCGSFEPLVNAAS